MNGMPQQQSPWLGMQTQPSPEEMQQAMMQQQLMQQQQMPQGMMVAQNAAPSPMGQVVQGFKNNMPINFQSQTPKPSQPPADAYPGFGNMITRKVRKIQGS